MVARGVSALRKYSLSCHHGQSPRMLLPVEQVFCGGGYTIESGHLVSNERNERAKTQSY